MSDNQFMKNNTPELGNIKVSKEVVDIIAALETIKVKGVVGISSGHKAGSVNVLSKKDIAKGIEVWMKPGEAVVTVSIITDYEVGIFKVAEEVQKKTKNAIEVMTGLKVLKINVNVHGVKFKEEAKKTKEKKQKDVKK
ncbi:MAG: Asp23/Gls24 family envelope stress response protein [Candidatus Atribacteria bacterium]